MASTASYKPVVLAAQGTAPQEELGPGQPRLSWSGSVWPLEEPAGLGPQQEGPGTRGMLCGVHSFPHLHPELSCTTHLSKPLLSAITKVSPAAAQGAQRERGAGTQGSLPWQVPCTSPLPVLLGSSRAGRARGDG